MVRLAAIELRIIEGRFPRGDPQHGAPPDRGATSNATTSQCSESSRDLMGTYVVVLSSAAAARMAEDTAWQIRGLPCATGKPVEVSLYSLYIDLGLASKFPSRLVAEVVGEAASLEEALSAFGQTVNLITPIIALAVNAHVPGFQFDLAYENGQATNEHPFAQWFRQKQDRVMFPLQRPIDPNLVQRVITQILKSPEGARLHRASLQYQEALGAWTSAEELRAVMHLWMAVEALTKVALRHECAARGATDDELVASWGIEKKELDGEVRRRLIFSGDDGCYPLAKKTSDGLEHMFEDFPKLQAQAMQCRNCCARKVRAYLLDQLDLSGDDRARLAEPPFDGPLSLVTLDRTIHGTITGPGGQLAREGYSHPQLEDWRPKIVNLTKTATGYEMDMADDYKIAISPKAQLRVEGMGTQIEAKQVQVKKIASGENGADSGQG